MANFPDVTVGKQLIVGEGNPFALGVGPMHKLEDLVTLKVHLFLVILDHFHSCREL